MKLIFILLENFSLPLWQHIAWALLRSVRALGYMTMPTAMVCGPVPGHSAPINPCISLLQQIFHLRQYLIH